MDVDMEEEDAEVQSWSGDFDPLADPAECRVLFAALDSFSVYRITALQKVTHVRRQAFYSLQPQHWKTLAAPPFSMLDTFIAVDDAIEVNAQFAEAILRAGLLAFHIPDELTLQQHDTKERLKFDLDEDDPNQQPLDPRVEKHRLDWRGSSTSDDRMKASTAMRQMYRDWSAEGAAERNACYLPVLRALSAEFPVSNAPRHATRVLVPGAGLGRLLFDICCAGFTAEGNEISYHMLLASSLILNHTTRAHEWALHPWAHGFSNHVRRADQLQRVTFPDVHPFSALNEPESGSGHDGTRAGERLSMVAADFCVHYNTEAKRDSFNAVVTVFFIDTAPNLMLYIEAVRNCLKAGGVWINVGPLQWHFNAAEKTGLENESHDHLTLSSQDSEADRGIGALGSVELAHDEVMALLRYYDFDIERGEIGQIDSGYIQDPRSLLQHVYKPVLWVARKR